MSPRTKNPSLRDRFCQPEEEEAIPANPPSPSQTQTRKGASDLGNSRIHIAFGAYECIQALKKAFQDEENVGSLCPRIYKGKFKESGTKGYSLEEIYDALRDTKDITSILVPRDREYALMDHVMGNACGDDVDAIDPIVDSWNKILSENRSIWWEDLYNLDLQSRVPKPISDPVPEPENHESSSGWTKLEEMVNKRLEEGFNRIHKRIDLMDTMLKYVEAYVIEQRNQRKYPFMDFEYEVRSYERSGFEYDGTSGTAGAQQGEGTLPTAAALQQREETPAAATTPSAVVAAPLQGEQQDGQVQQRQEEEASEQDFEAFLKKGTTQKQVSTLVILMNVSLLMKIITGENLHPYNL